MALLKCTECNNDVSEYADKCPQCGCPISIILNQINNKEDNSKTYCIINGEKKDVTYFVNKILDGSWNEDVLSFNIKLMNELDVSMLKFVKTVEQNNGAPAEYNDKSIKEWKKKQEQKQELKPKCPMCGSTNIQKISNLNRTSSIIGFGILSKKIGKQWQCNNPKCKHLW